MSLVALGLVLFLKILYNFTGKPSVPGVFFFLIFNLLIAFSELICISFCFFPIDGKSSEFGKCLIKFLSAESSCVYRLL